MQSATRFALFSALWGFHVCPAGEFPTASIAVLVFDYADVSAAVLNGGLSQAKRILKSGGVEVEWVHCPVVPERLAQERQCRDAPRPLTLVVHILPTGATRRQTDPGAGGFAVPEPDGGFGTFAGVFYGRVKQLGNSISESAALGHLMAHELGHLLLGTGQHSAGGIMKSDWGYQQIVKVAQGVLRFGPSERVRILTNIQHRILASLPHP